MISNKFNDFFFNVGPSVANKIPHQDTPPEYYLRNRASYSFYLEPFTENKKEAAAGHDGLRTSILKLSLPHISSPLTYVINLSFIEGIFHDEMKIANVIPLFKCDDQEMFNNYRPVSLSKVFEKVMYGRLIKCLDAYSILFHINLVLGSFIPLIWSLWQWRTNWPNILIMLILFLVFS